MGISLYGDSLRFMSSLSYFPDEMKAALAGEVMQAGP